MESAKRLSSWRRDHVRCCASLRERGQTNGAPGLHLPYFRIGGPCGESYEQVSLRGEKGRESTQPSSASDDSPSLHSNGSVHVMH